jgi:CRISPR system Cascade subunit CasD
MNDAFLLHLRGPLQSYADTGFGPIREAGGFPSRSAVIGLIASAMGIERGEQKLLALHQAFRVHVAVAQSGQSQTDFHTVDSGAKNKAVTYRDYHHDAYFLALVEARTPSDAPLVSEAVQALRRPRWVAYLGRKSCPPSIPLQPRPAKGTSAIEVLTREARAVQARREKKRGVRILLDDASFAPSDSSQEGVTVRGSGERRDQLVGAKRSYSGRRYTDLHVASDPSQHDDPQTDYFRATPDTSLIDGADAQADFFDATS